jgi:uncharacterized protein (TIGR03435 family)
VLAGAAITLVSVGQMDGQSSQAAVAPAAFEVASIKPVVPPFPSAGGPWIVNRGRFRAQVAWVRGVIGWAYDVLAVQVHGGPGWVDSERYDFDARGENTYAGPDQIKVMVQALLTDRFKLAVRRETQDAQVYTLVVGKSGPKIEEAKDGGRHVINWAGRGQIEFDGVGIVGLVNVLSPLLGSPVVDKTALRGLYNFRLEFTNPQVQRLSNDGQPAVDSRPDLFGAVEEQLGLKLEAKKGPVEVLVIDHIERASEN